MPEKFNQAVAAARFRITEVLAHVLEDQDYRAAFIRLNAKYSERELKEIFSALIRFAFFIEPVKQPAIESTKFNVRWSEKLANDPRFCSFENCVVIFKHLLTQLEEESQHGERVEIIKLVNRHNLISYELNIDYISRLSQNIHNVDNIAFFWDDAAKQTYLLRKYLLNPANHNYITFFRETYTKIGTKAFLTDRVLTGDHKTNREKRWECHPASVHFALRKECLRIERKLIQQICHFEDFPPDLKQLLQENQVITFQEVVAACPITLEPFSFDRFSEEVQNPTHGKASVQVGHIHPLKAGENAVSGHTADNISWISSAGNRIQGDLSVEETQAMILRIIENYRNAGLVD
jgi:hypothetical protein